MVKKAVLSSVVLLGFATQAMAASCEGQSDNCRARGMWYVGGELGKANSSVGNRELNSFYDSTDFIVDSVTIDDSDTALSIYAGYRFNKTFAIEFGYVDLGERSIGFKGEVFDEDKFLRHARAIYPVSGDGPTLALVAGMPIGERFTIDGRIGLFAASGEYQTIELQNPQRRIGGEEYDSIDLWSSLRLGYHFNKNWQVNLNYSAYTGIYGDDSVKMTSIGVTYSF